MIPRKSKDGMHGDTLAPLPQDIGAEPPPWEMIENGRYMPRRIRGSFRGRELG